MSKDKFHVTARARNKVSVPMRVLRDNDLLKGRSLDYGCGRGDDADALGMEKYDPTGPNTAEPQGKFQTITCIFVLNVIESPAERRSVENSITQLLVPGGHAYIAVRDDVHEDGPTSRGGWQGSVRPSRGWKQIHHMKNRFRIYEYKTRARRKHKCKTCN